MIEGDVTRVKRPCIQAAKICLGAPLSEMRAEIMTLVSRTALGTEGFLPPGPIYGLGDIPFHLLIGDAGVPLGDPAHALEQGLSDLRGVAVGPQEAIDRLPG